MALYWLWDYTCFHIPDVREVVFLIVNFYCYESVLGQITLTLKNFLERIFLEETEIDSPLE
jgi:hypothetical protein